MIAVVGDIAVDMESRLRVPLSPGSASPADIGIAPGGSGANVAVWLARKACPVTLIARVGDDLFGNWLASNLVAEGVQPALVVDPHLATGVIQVLVEPDGERTIIPDRGANAVWCESDIPEDVIAGADLLHVSGYVLMDARGSSGALQAMAYARKHHVPISLDPSSHLPSHVAAVEAFWSLVGDLAVLLPNRHEAEVLTGQSDPEEALAVLERRAALVAIKLDRDGCIAGAQRRRWRVPAEPTQISNATGAGDAFNAAFLARWLETQDVEEACRAGVQLGTYAAGLPTTR